MSTTSCLPRQLFLTGNLLNSCTQLQLAAAMTTKSTFPEDVVRLVSPHLLDALFLLEIPWPKATPLTTKQWNTPTSDQTRYKTLCWDALVAVSKIPLSTAKKLDFLTLLPDPHAVQFPTQAVGLVVLLDQAPRLLCCNRNERWRNSFFDELALMFSFQLRSLPPSAHIHDPARWEAMGYSYEHFCAISNFLTAPFAHAEDIAIHEKYLLPEVRESRSRAERRYGVIDEKHAEEVAEGTTLDASGNVTEFVRLVRSWVPPEASFVEVVFWWCRVKEAHTPIVRTFGHYPYRNRAVGRRTTEAEEEFLRDTENFGVSVDEDATNMIREDVERGVWTPLE